MLLATMLNYMDRQTLAQQATDIRGELRLSNESYGWLETGFGLAFAVGSLVTGAIADRVSLRWLYPAILLGWSAVGFMTGWVSNYTELFLCRVLLGFFEAGQWPCALAASQRLLPRDRRPLGNSILQSGASLGAIATPPIILLLNHGEPGGWRLPFQVVGAAGLIWIFVWLMAIRPRDLDIARPIAARRIVPTWRRRPRPNEASRRDSGPPISCPGRGRHRHQPLLAVLPSLDAHDAREAVRLQQGPDPELLLTLLPGCGNRLSAGRASWSRAWPAEAGRFTGRGWRHSRSVFC